MEHPDPRLKARMIEWARGILNQKHRYVILDTETTGIGYQDVVIEIAVIDLNGNVLLNSRIRPTKKKGISKRATGIHGITMEELTSAPTFGDVCKELNDIIGNKSIIIYNGDFDERLIRQTCRQDGIPPFKLGWYECAMTTYSRFVGDWSDYHGDYTFKRLPLGDHTAVGDCRATLKVIQKMAESPMSVKPGPRFIWEFWKW